MEVSKRKHDLVKLQLMLQGGISPQVTSSIGGDDSIVYSPLYVYR